jgi:hypothetical protein
MKPLTFIFLLMALWSPLARAELKVDGGRIPVNPKPEDETITVEFTFKNHGDKPVKILSLESGCHCLLATLDKPVYAPGEAGKGKAEFKVGSFVGDHEKVVIVTTDDPAQKDWQIPFLLTVPEVVSIEPKNVQWWVGEKASPKTMTVKITGPEPMKITNISSTRESMEHSWKAVKEGREYVVTLQPKSTEEVVIGALKIETDSRIPKYQRQMGFFSIVRQPASRADEPVAGVPATTPKADAP